VAILFPERVRALVLEATHFLAAKTSSLDFFESGISAPERFGAEAMAALERDHGPAWREVVASGGRAWLRIIEEGRRHPGLDLYGGRLGEVKAPTLLLHGRRDPRTEPGELDALLRALPAARLELLDAGHGPHTSATAAERCIALGVGFIEREAAPP
jgi:3-oxoadipate enol-lactonase